MKCIIVLCTLAALAVAETYEPTNDSFDIEALVGNKEAFQTYTTCFIEGTGCDDVANDFKKDLKEVYELSCGKCTTAQKHILKRYIEELKQQLPDRYLAFKKKYDPEGKHSAGLEAAVANA